MDMAITPSQLVRERPTRMNARLLQECMEELLNGVIPLTVAARKLY